METLLAWADSKESLKRLASDEAQSTNMSTSISHFEGEGREVRTGLTLGIRKSNSQSLSRRISLGVIGGDVVDPGSVGSEVGGEFDFGGDCGRGDSEIGQISVGS